jgi:hypothetical protein
MPIIRCFQTDVETVADAWRLETLTSLAWSSPGNPGEAGGQAQGFFVKCGGLTGFAKPSKQANEPPDAPPRAAHEKIASDLAFDLRLPVPPVVMWRRQVSTPGQEARKRPSCRRYGCGGIRHVRFRHLARQSGPPQRRQPLGK